MVIDLQRRASESRHKTGDSGGYKLVSHGDPLVLRPSGGKPLVRPISPRGIPSSFLWMSDIAGYCHEVIRQKTDKTGEKVTEDVKISPALGQYISVSASL